MNLVNKLKYILYPIQNQNFMMIVVIVMKENGIRRVRRVMKTNMRRM